MPSSARTAASQFVEAVLAHLAAVEASTGESDPGVREAYNRLAETFSAYEDALFDDHDEVLPFEIVEEDDEDEDDEEFEDDEGDDEIADADSDDADSEADEEADDDDLEWVDVHPHSSGTS